MKEQKPKLIGRTAWVNTISVQDKTREVTVCLMVSPAGLSRKPCCGHQTTKDKGHPRMGHEDPEGESRYSSTRSLTSALAGVGGQGHAAAAIPPGKDPVPFV